MQKELIDVSKFELAFKIEFAVFKCIYTYLSERFINSLIMNIENELLAILTKANTIKLTWWERW